MTQQMLAVVLGLGLVCATGCGKKRDADDDHGHGNGPHGGVVIDFGKYHAEFKPDHAKKEATVWILGSDAKKPARIKADKLRLVVSNANPKIEIDLLATDTDADSTASTFVGKNDGFAVEMEYKGTIAADIDGKAVSAEFEEKAEPKK